MGKRLPCSSHRHRRLCLLPASLLHRYPHNTEEAILHFVRYSRTPYRTPLKTMHCLCWTFKGLLHTKLKFLSCCSKPICLTFYLGTKIEWGPGLASSKMTETYQSIIKMVHIEISFWEILECCVDYAFPCNWAKHWDFQASNRSTIKVVHVTPEAIS